MNNDRIFELEDKKWKENQNNDFGKHLTLQQGKLQISIFNVRSYVGDHYAFHATIKYVWTF